MGLRGTDDFAVSLGSPQLLETFEEISDELGSLLAVGMKQARGRDDRTVGGKDFEDLLTQMKKAGSRHAAALTVDEQAAVDRLVLLWQYSLLVAVQPSVDADEIRSYLEKLELRGHWGFASREDMWLEYAVALARRGEKQEALSACEVVFDRLHRFVASCEEILGSAEAIRAGIEEDRYTGKG